MRLYGAIQKVEPQDDGTVRVHGIATSEAVDDQGEIVRADAMRVAIPDYMRFPALREMHQLSAAGTTLEAEVCEDGSTRIVAHVVDPVAVAKVKNQVYRGFSIGGRVTQREPGNPKAISSLVLSEISLVDRPANPEAVFDCWKASAVSPPPQDGPGLPGWIRDAEIPAPPAPEVFNSAIQVWACGVSDHRHLAKSEALKCLGKRSVTPTEAKAVIAPTVSAVAKAESTKHKEPARDVQYADPGCQPDGKKRYPIDTDHHIRSAYTDINKPENPRKYQEDQIRRVKAEIISAWNEKIGKDSPSSAGDAARASRAELAKALGDIGHIARVIVDLDQLKEVLHTAAAMENDNSQQPARFQVIISELCGFLNALLAEEAGEILGDTEIEGSLLGPEMPGMLTAAAGTSGVARIAALLGKGKPKMRERTADLLAKARRSQADHALLNMAQLACDNCVRVGGLSADEAEHIREACDHLLQAGAAPIDIPAFDTTKDEQLEPQAVVATALGKRERAHRQIMDIAHECLSALSDGTMCRRATKVEARHSKEVMEHLGEAHRHLIAAGARCDAARAIRSSTLTEEGQPGTEFEYDKALRPTDLVKALAGERAEKTVLANMLAEIAPTLERLTKRIDDIERTPLPPLTIAKGSVSISKQQDRNSMSGGDSELSAESVASALAKMSKEEQTMMLIKASYANPIRIPGSTAGER